jgi:LacI family transcriptional regulator
VGEEVNVNEPATIYDVASLARVSIATVSRVLNGSAHVRPTTKARVEAAIAQLQFVPSSAARGLSGGRRGLIGLAYPLDEARSAITPSRDDDASALYTDAIIRSASWQASLLGYSLFSCAVRVDDLTGARLALQQLATAVDGMILADRVTRDEEFVRVAENLPAVHLSGSGAAGLGGTIRVDNHGGITAVVEHLATVHGIRDFGYVDGIAASPDALARRLAFDETVAAVGGTARAANLLTGDFSLLRAEAATEDRLADPTPLPEVFVCANDQMALGVTHCLQVHGLAVPNQIRVTGFDDIGLASYSKPRLTTVAQPSFQLGVSAVNLVVGLLDGVVDTGTIVTLPTELRVRASCGCFEDEVPTLLQGDFAHAGS